jgi:hypothetical protein
MPTATLRKHERQFSIDEKDRITWEKDEDEVLDFTLDWADFLDGDTIATSTWENETGGVVIDSSSNTTTTTTVWVSKADGVLKNTVVTDGLRTHVRRMKFVSATR